MHVLVWIWQNKNKEKHHDFFFKTVTSIWCYHFFMFFLMLSSNFEVDYLCTLITFILKLNLHPVHILCKTLTLSQQGTSVAKLIGPKLIKDPWRHWLDQNRVCIDQKKFSKCTLRLHWVLKKKEWKKERNIFISQFIVGFFSHHQRLKQSNKEK